MLPGSQLRTLLHSAAASSGIFNTPASVKREFRWELQLPPSVRDAGAQRSSRDLLRDASRRLRTAPLDSRHFQTALQKQECAMNSALRTLLMFDRKKTKRNQNSCPNAHSGAALVDNSDRHRNLNKQKKKLRKSSMTFAANQP